MAIKKKTVKARTVTQEKATLLANTPGIGAMTAEQVEDAMGLLTPTLGYLAAYCTAADLPLLVELFDRHPPLRSVALNLIEAQGARGRGALRERLRLGADDGPALASLERRLAVLDACVADGERRR